MDRLSLDFMDKLYTIDNRDDMIVLAPNRRRVDTLLVRRKLTRN